MSDNTSPFSDSPYFSLAQQDAGIHNINPQFFTTQIGQESSFDPTAQNGIHIGLGQFAPKTAADYHIDPSNPAQSLYAASAYDSDLLAQCSGDYVCVAQRYGTLPKSGTLSTGQQLVYNAAIAANNQSGYNASWYDQALCKLGFFSHCIDPAGHAQTALSSLLGLPDTPKNNALLASLNPNALTPSPTPKTCSNIDVICNFENFLAQRGVDLLAMVLGLILIVIGLVMLKAPEQTANAIGNIKSAPVNYANKLRKLAGKKIKISVGDAAALAVT